KEAKKKKPTGKLMGDGLPSLLTSDEFYERVVRFTSWQKQQEVEAKMKADARVQWKVALEKWEQQCKVVAEEKEELRREVVVWEKQKKAAKAAKERFNIRKPARKIANRSAKPLLKTFMAAALAEAQAQAASSTRILEGEELSEDEDVEMGEISDESDDDDDL
ncbi:hypothetical protein BKA70DRAFT_1124800, partial [Coprinopsis sp. MPI-PUGE-AT-0042]